MQQPEHVPAVTAVAARYAPLMKGPVRGVCVMNGEARGTTTWPREAQSASRDTSQRSDHDGLMARLSGSAVVHVTWHYFFFSPLSLSLPDRRGVDRPIAASLTQLVGWF